MSFPYDIGIGSDTRIGKRFLFAGVGYGGSCFPKDIRALRAMADERSYETPLLSAVQAINEEQKELLGKKMISYFKREKGIENSTIAIWGLSFKPNTDDMREAPSLALIQRLLDLGVKLRIYDPVCIEKAKKLFPNHPKIHFSKDAYDAANGADGIALLTEWHQFRMVDFKKVLVSMEGKAVFDGRNQYKFDEMRNNGFDYFGIGVPDHAKHDSQ